MTGHWRYTDEFMKGTNKVDRRKAYANGHRPHARYDRCARCGIKWLIADR